MAVAAQLDPDVIQYRRVGMYARDDSPVIGPPGDGASAVKIDGARARRAWSWGAADRLCLAHRAVTMTRPDAKYAGLIQVLVFHSEMLDYVGYLEPGSQQVWRLAWARGRARVVVVVVEEGRGGWSLRPASCGMPALACRSETPGHVAR